ncbi:MAG: hypothetical protein ACKOC5_18805 [Chloroflexota bacterium]
MLPRSRQSALWLSLAAVLAFSLTSAILNLLLPYLLTGDVHSLVERPEALQQPGGLLSLVLVLLVVEVVLALIGWLWIYRYFGERYYGQRGLVFWALFGLLLALLLKLPDYLPGGGPAALTGAWRAISAFPAFFLARRLAGIRPGHKA